MSQTPRRLRTSPERGGYSSSEAPYAIVVRDVADGDYPRRRLRQPGVLSLYLAGGRTLPVFHSGAEAARFAESWNEALVQEGLPEYGVRGGWRPRSTGAGELLSLLSGSAFSAGPCADVERVLLDPPADAIPELRRGFALDRPGEPLSSLSRACFLERLMGRGGARPAAPGAGGYGRRA